jgi:MoxR-like ATPase
MFNKIEKLKKEIAKVIIGQEEMIDGLLVGLFCKGHILVEGVPGLAKTTTIKTISLALNLEFKRVQFTPDLLPTDIIGAQIYNPKDSTFQIKKGPIFTQLLLADEINRSPSKVQSALLEAMQERQVTIGEESFRLSEPFMVMATQNPLEQEGTYKLPEAQLDRFMMKLIIKHNSPKEELEIMRRVAQGKTEEINPIMTKKEIENISKEINNIHIDKELEEYIISIIFETRKENPYIEYGVSPRGSIDLYKASKAYAYMQGRDYVTPIDIVTMMYPVLRHRIGLSFEAKANNITTDKIIQNIIDSVVMP